MGAAAGLEGVTTVAPGTSVDRWPGAVTAASARTAINRYEIPTNQAIRVAAPAADTARGQTAVSAPASCASFGDFESATRTRGGTTVSAGTANAVDRSPACATSTGSGGGEVGSCAATATLTTGAVGCRSAIATLTGVGDRATLRITAVATVATVAGASGSAGASLTAHRPSRLIRRDGRYERGAAGTTGAAVYLAVTA